jgi:DNA-directed RNA polymerase subunit N (RpoN/RPB10)
MIIPMVCFTCGTPISHLWQKYTDYVKNYEDMGETNPEFLALKDLNIGRHCCRRMFICQHDMYHKIK